METKRYINGVRVIHYDPTVLERFQNIGVALEVKKKLKKELDKQLVDKKKYKESVNRLNEVLKEFALYN